MSYGIIEDDAIIAKFVAPLNVISNVPFFSSDSLSLKRNIQRRPAQRWEITAHLEPLKYTANDLFVLLTTKNVYETFEVTMPQNIGVIKNRVISGSDPVCVLGDIDSTTIIVNSRHIIPKGTFIKFNNHSKIYMITTNKVGTTYKIFPALREALSNIKFKWLDDVKMSVYLDENAITGMAFTDGILMDNGEMTFVEALND